MSKCGTIIHGRNNKYGNLVKKRSVSLLLLSSSLYFGGGLIALVMRKSCSSIANFKRPSFVEVKMNESSNNNPRISSSEFLSKKLTFGTRLGAVWQDLQDEPRWKYEQLSPVQLLEKSKLPRNSTDIDELARANWFWSRRPRLLPTTSWIVWLIVVLGLPFWLFSIPAFGVPLLIIAAVLVGTEIVRSVRWRRQYESSIGRLLRTSKNDRDSFGVAGVR